MQTSSNMKILLLAILMLSSQAHCLPWNNSRPELRAVTQAVNDFTSQFTKELLANRTTNTVFSPIIIDYALYMLCMGASEGTLQQMNEVLRVRCHNIDIQKGYYSMMYYFNNADNLEINVATSIFANRAFPINARFKTRFQQIFGDSIFDVNFSQKGETVKVINDWVSQATRQKITNMIEEDGISANTDMMMLSAIYFNGLWKHELDPNSTRILPFTHNGVSKYISFMLFEGSLTYAVLQRPKAIVFKLPYSNEEYSMWIVLPFLGTKLEDTVKDMDLINARSIQDQLQTGNTILQVPKFKLTNSFELGPILRKMGLERMFNSSRSEFLTLTQKRPFSVDSVIHKAVINVDEKGSKAAAVTPTGLSWEPPSYIVDRPFLFMIMHEPTKLKLFAGTIYSPEL